MKRCSTRMLARVAGLAFTAFVAQGAAAQTQGGNLTIAFPANQEPAMLDGHIDPYQSTWLFNSLVADPLIVLDSDGSYKPALAASWESTPDG